MNGQLTPEQLSRLSPEERKEMLVLMLELEKRKTQNKIDQYYRNEGPLRRDLYQKHLEFFRAGKEYRERCAMCANRIGKTEGMGAYETALHLTGQYPDWWEGRVFDRAVKFWAAGKTNETTRDIVQAKLFGMIDDAGSRKAFTGTGLVRGRTLGGITWKQGVQDLADTVKVKHVSGDWSILGLKSYQQGRGAFEGTEQDGVWLDEEPPIDIYGECLIRTATTNGIILATFTPLDGVTETVLQFLPGGLSA